MILIHPPVAKQSEPPAGLARLSGALSQHKVKHKVLDANLEALLYLINNRTLQGPYITDRWARRAFRDLTKNIASLKEWKIYSSIDRYKRAVIDLNHAVEMSANNGFIVGLSDLHHHDLSPLRSDDLIRASERPEQNPFYHYFSRRLSGLVQEMSGTLVGFSLNYLSQALCTFAMAGFLKKEFPGISIVLGGGLVTSWMRNPKWSNPFGGLVDHLVAGPGEYQLLSIMGIKDVKGKHFTPSYDYLPLNDYLSPGPVLPYNASSGCCWSKCSFCPETAEDNPYTQIAIEQVVSDLDTLVAKHDPALVHLLDNSVNTVLLKKLAGGPLHIPWYGFVRITKLLVDIDFCRALKRSGCVMLKLGLESGDQRVLDNMQKGIDLETASLALKTLKKAGIATYVYLLFGTPEETLPEARKTLEFVVRHKDEIRYLNLAIFNMPVCRADSTKFQTSSFYEGDLSLYTDFLHPRGWGRKQVRRFLDNEFKRNDAVAEILRRDPPVFTSNHAPFFEIKAC